MPSCMLGESFSLSLKTIMLAVMHMNSFSYDGCVEGIQQLLVNLFYHETSAPCRHCVG